MHLKRSVLLAVVLLVGCHAAPKSGPQREYGFVHMETTGLTSGIVGPGLPRRPSQPKGSPDVTIIFSDASDRDAVKALNSLAASVLLPNANGNGIAVVGVLDPIVRHTETGPDRPASEPYQEFRLTRWYLRAPFVRHQFRKGPLDTPAVEHDHRLRPEDFGGQVNGDLSRFVRPR